MSLEDLRNERLGKLEKLREAEIEPYPAESKRTHDIASAVHHFDKFVASGEAITLAGRIMALRKHGAAVFADLYDGSVMGQEPEAEKEGSVQIFLGSDRVGEQSFKQFDATVDVGDFVEAGGTLFLTKHGEKTLEARSWRMLTKSLRPLPDKWHGLTDPEERFRRRYLDILLDPAMRHLVYKRALFWQGVRNFLLERNFIEVETPTIETTPGGAEVRPFITHHNALDMETTLRISAGELWQKRLMISGMPKTFEIGRIFRNEGMSAEHLQDYTQMEFYWAYASFRDGMQLVEELYKTLAQQVFGTLTFSIHGHNVDLGQAWPTIDYRGKIKEETGVDIAASTLNDLVGKLDALHVEYDKNGLNKTRAFDALWKYCRRKISGPAFLTDVPVELEPLAKRNAEDPTVVERFQVILGGSEVGKGFSELNDPLDQAVRFKEQQALRDAGDAEAQWYDADYIEAMEYGMPPTCGFGVSERLFAFLAGLPVREAQLFPLMRPRA